MLSDAADTDAETGPRHALPCITSRFELNKALKAAENALDVEWTEDSFKVLQDIKSQITTVDGTEALIEGFGSLFGRAAAASKSEPANCAVLLMPELVA